MGRYDFRAQRVLATANQLLETNRISTPPPWYNIVQDVPPAAALTRPVFRDARTVSEQRAAKRIGKSSRQFQQLRESKSRLQDHKMKKIFRPMDIGHGEDRLRVEFFGDHPWELARPRVILEDGGNDSVDYNWSHIKQPSKRLDGESVIQRQLYLMNVEGLHKELAYDVARKEFYQYRHLEEVERRIAKEEALSTGAYFGKGPNEISLQLEDQIWEHWKTWAFEQVEKEKQRNASAYSGTDSEEAESADPLLEPGLLEAELEEMSEAVPATKEGQDALGGAPVHP